MRWETCAWLAAVARVFRGALWNIAAGTWYADVNVERVWNIARLARVTQMSLWSVVVNSRVVGTCDAVFCGALWETCLIFIDTMGKYCNDYPVH